MGRPERRRSPVPRRRATGSPVTGASTRRRARTAITVTLAGGHEWYEAPVGPDLLLVSDPDAPLATADDGSDLRGAQRSEGPVDPRCRVRWCRHRSARRISTSGSARSPTATCFSSVTRPSTTIPPPAMASRSGCSSPSAWPSMPATFSSGSPSADRRRSLRADHPELVRDRRRLTQLALFLARSPWLSRRAARRCLEGPARAEPS